MNSSRSAGCLLILMLVLLAGGVWIAMTLAIVGWVGRRFSPTPRPGKNLFSAFWESNASLGAGGAAAVHLDGRDPVPHQAVGGDVRRPAPWLNRVPGRLMHTTILGCGIFGSVSGSSAATCATIAKVALPELDAARLRRKAWRSARWPPPARWAS